MTKGKRERKKRKIRATVRGTKDRPRLCVTRSVKNIYAQLIDDTKGITIIGFSTKALKQDKDVKVSKIEKAKKLGVEVAKKAKSKKITKIVFDRSGYLYHGRVKAVAEGAREGGLKF